MAWPRGERSTPPKVANMASLCRGCNDLALIVQTARGKAPDAGLAASPLQVREDEVTVDLAS